MPMYEVPARVGGGARAVGGHRAHWLLVLGDDDAPGSRQLPGRALPSTSHWRPPTCSWPETRPSMVWRGHPDTIAPDRGGRGSVTRPARRASHRNRSAMPNYGRECAPVSGRMPVTQRELGCR